MALSKSNCRFFALTILTILLVSVYAPFSHFGVSASGSWLTGWTHRRQLTVNGSLITEVLTDFPVLVRLDSSFFDFNEAKDHGEDVRFTTSDGTSLLKYEIERWNKTAGKAEIWVKLPSVSSGSDTVFYFYYANPSASDAQDPTNVWDSNFMMVQHLEETSGLVTDSTSHGNNGNYSGVGRGAEGKIDGAYDFDGVDDYVAINHSQSLNFGTGPFTISVWVKYDPNNVDSDIVRKGCTTNQPPSPSNYKLELVNNALHGNLHDNTHSDASVTTPLTYSDDLWHCVVFLREAQTISLYVDGGLKASAGSAVHDLTNTANMSIGSKDTLDDDFFDGIIDEVQTSNTNRSSAWIKASYSSMSGELVSIGSELIQNEAPNRPFNPSPANGATGVPTSTMLAANVTDPDGDNMDVYFYEPSSTKPQADNFTLVALPDTQIYAESYPSIFDNQTQWIADTTGSMKTVFVTHEGDVVNVNTQTIQWDRANNSMSKLDGKVPWAIAPGNHELDSNITNYNTYFGYSRFNGKSWYGGAYQNVNTNSYELFSGGDDDYLIFHFQYGVNDSVLAWANTTIASYPNRRVIVTTHDYMDSAGTRSTTGTLVWNDFVAPHADLVFLVLCGHTLGEANRTDIVNGHPVYQLLADYQGRTNGGNGWLRTMEFHPVEDKIYVRTYSPYLTSYETDSDSQFTLNYNMTHQTSSPPLLVGVDTNVSSGGIASAAWNGLNTSTTYQWYTVAVDTHAASNQSDTWNFTTGTGECTLYINPALVEKNLTNVGSTFELRASIQNVVDLFGFDLNITWNGALLTLTNVEYSDEFDALWGPGNWVAVKNQSGPGWYKLVATSTLSGFSGSEPLVKLTFRIEYSATNQETPIHLDTHKLSDSHYTAIAHVAQDGTYKITGETPRLVMSPTTKTCRIYGETFMVRINVTNPGNAKDFTFEIHYNATVLDVAGVSWDAWGSGTYSADELNGNLTGYTSGGPLSTNVTLVTITFKATWHHIWKDLPNWTNDVSSAIYFQWANLSYQSTPDLRYERGGLNQIEVGSDFIYTFSPIQGDVDNNGVVDVFDIRTVAAFYETYNATYNLTGEDIVDVYDIVVVSSNFGYTYTP